MTAYFENDRVTVYHGDCIEVMRQLPDNSVDAVVTDPPYGLEFMGKDWDAPWKAGKVEWANEGTDKSHPFRDGSARIEYGIGGKASLGFQTWFTEVATEALRVLKPGGHLLAFGGTRTWHRLAVAIEDAGFEVRDSIAWMYGSGFPKSLDVSKAIDKRAGAEREVVGVQPYSSPDTKSTRLGFASIGVDGGDYNRVVTDITAPATPAAEQWQGWGTALKPAHEPIVVARKPLIGTVAENILTHGTGALNIDGCRIGNPPEGDPTRFMSMKGSNIYAQDEWTKQNMAGRVMDQTKGRWPANVILDESQAAELDKQSGVSVSNAQGGKRPPRREGSGWDRPCNDTHEATMQAYGDTGGASRFFYVAKANKKERPNVNGVAHPTVKPMALMQYLVRLVTPPGGTVLEPFAGSGTTIEAALNEGFNVIGIEMTDEYLPLIMSRIERYGDKLL